MKARRITPANPSRELGAIRDIAGQHFDFLAGLLFDQSCDVIYRAAIIPHAVVMKHARPAPHSNSHKFLLRDDIWDVPGVCDVTDKLSAAAPHSINPNEPPRRTHSQAGLRRGCRFVWPTCDAPGLRFQGSLRAAALPAVLRSPCPRRD